MDVKHATNWPLTAEEQGQLLINVQYLNCRQGLKFSLQEYLEMDRALTLKVAHQKAGLLNGAITLLVVHALRKKVHQRYNTMSIRRQAKAHITLTVAEWMALREIILYHPWDSLMLRSALGKIDQALPISNSHTTHEIPY